MKTDIIHIRISTCKTGSLTQVELVQEIVMSVGGNAFYKFFTLDYSTTKWDLKFLLKKITEMVNWQFSFKNKEKILCKMSSQNITLHNSWVVLVFLHTSSYFSNDRALDAGRSVTQDTASHVLLLEIREQQRRKARKP